MLAAFGLLVTSLVSGTMLWAWLSVGVSVAAALHHPRLASPLVYLGGRELAPLLETLPPGRTPLEIAQSWSNRMPLESGMAIAGWLVSHGILVEQHGGAPS